MLFERLASRWRGRLRGLARAAVIVTLALALLQSIAYTVPALSTWWLELMQYVPYPTYLVPALAALVLSFGLGWRWRVAAVIGVGLVLTIVMGLAIGRSDTGSKPLRMMTYNIKAYLADQKEGGYEAIAAEVASHNPDLLVMQDAIELTQRHYERPGLVHDLFTGRYPYQHGQYIVLSRFPLRDCEAIPLPQPPQHATADYVHCVLTVQGVDIDLYTAHLLSPRSGLNATRRELADGGLDDWQENFNLRLAQARKIAADLSARRSGRPMILAGDLNAAETSPVIRTLLDRGLRDAFSSAGFGYGYSHGHALRFGFSFLRIDHILVSPEIGVVDAHPGGWQASEHRPVIADLLLKRSNR